MIANGRPRIVDVVIAGAGVVGLSLAVALKHSLGSGLAIAISDPPAASLRPGNRASAIAAGPRRMFETLGVWREIEDRAQPIIDMIITDSRSGDPVRPVFLSFDGEIAPGEPFAHMAFIHDLTAALIRACERSGVIFIGGDVHDWQVAHHDVTAFLSQGAPIRCRLLVAADGARSQLRQQAGIGVSGWSYGQSGIVATVAHERDHSGRAEEHFLPGGPFAILPLRDAAGLGRRSSIVWVEDPGRASQILSLDEGAFLEELELRFGQRLGAIRVEDKPQAFPLELQIARSFIGERLALIGDAAHVIHPIAGQGLNLGLRDAASLAEIVTEQARCGLDPGALDVLSSYQRSRRFDSVAMGLVTDILNRLFSNDLAALRLARDLGLGLVDRMPALKRAFIREAAGVMGPCPKLLRGEPI